VAPDLLHVGRNEVWSARYAAPHSSGLSTEPTHMGILSWIIFGLIAGALAKWIMPGNDPQGCLITMVLGIVGAFVGGYIGTLLGLGTVTGFDIRSFFLAIIGAIVLLALYRLVRGKRRV
jgi:uncharacterized membrane protein YeaQ/YmgE (transglycosylase-associated protein family)